jgi:hypothetical protein
MFITGKKIRYWNAYYISNTAIPNCGIVESLGKFCIEESEKRKVPNTAFSFFNCHRVVTGRFQLMEFESGLPSSSSGRKP